MPWAESGMMTRCRSWPWAVVPGPHEQQPGQLAGRPGGRLQGGGGHAGDLAQRLFQLDQQLQPALGAGGRGGRVDLGQAGQGGHRVADLGVVLHGARAQRVGPEVDRELPVAEPGEVADEVALGHLGQRQPARRGGGRPGPAPPRAARGPRWCAAGSAWRPGTDSSNSVGSASWPSSGALAARPPAAGRDEVVRASPHRLVEGRDVGVDLGPGPSLGHRHQQAVAASSAPTDRRRRARQVARATPARNPSSASRSTTTRRPAPECARRTPAPPAASPVSGSTPVEAEQAVPAVAGAPGAAQGHLGQARRCPASPAGSAAVTAISVWLVQTLRGGLLPSDVLLPGPQRGHVGPAALGVDRLADQAAGQPADLVQGAGEQPEVGAAEAQGRAEGLALPHHHVGAPVARATAGCRPTPGRPPRPAARRCGRSRPGPRPGPRGSPGSWGSRPRPPRAAAVGRTPSRPSRGPPVHQGHLDQLVAGARGEGGQHGPPVRVDPGRHPHLVAAGRRHPQVDRLDQGAGPVVERGVGHRQAGQAGHHGLELEHRLEHALGHLGLVGRVGGHELRPEARARPPGAPRGRRPRPRRSTPGRSARARLAAARSSSGRARRARARPRARSRPPARRSAAGTAAKSSSSEREPEEPEHGRQVVVGVGQVVGHQVALPWPLGHEAAGRRRWPGRCPAPDLDGDRGRRPRRPGRGVEEGQGDAPARASGEKLPLVTVADGGPARPGRRPRRGAAGGRRPRGPAAAVGAARRPARRSRAARPRNSPLSQPTTQPSPAWSGVMPGPELVAVQRQAGLEAQGVAGPQAGRHDPGVEHGLARTPGPPRPARRTRPRPRRCSRSRPPRHAGPRHAKVVTREAAARPPPRGPPGPAGAGRRGPARR